MEYKNQTTQSLVRFQETYINKLVDLQIANEDEEAMDRFKTELAKIDAELSCRGDAVSSTRAASSGARSTPGDTEGQMGKDMRASLDKVHELRPGVASTDFVASLENCYNNYVKDRPALEARFVKYAITRMCDSYQTQIHGAENKLVTWAQLKTFVLDNYGVRLTPYQKLDQLFDLQVNSSDWTGYCVSLQNSADEVLRFVESKFKKGHPTEELSSKKLFDIVAVQIFLRRLQEGPDHKAYDYICGQLHDVWDLNSALALAKNFIDRRNKSDSNDPVSDNAAFFGRTNQNRGQGQRNQGQSSRDTPKQGDSESKKSSEPKEGAPRFKFTLAALKAASPRTCLNWANKGKCGNKKCSFKHKWNLPEEEKSPGAEKSGESSFYAAEGFH